MERRESPDGRREAEIEQALGSSRWGAIGATTCGNAKNERQALGKGGGKALTCGNVKCGFGSGAILAPMTGGLSCGFTKVGAATLLPKEQGSRARARKPGV